MLALIFWVTQPQYLQALFIWEIINEARGGDVQRAVPSRVDDSAEFELAFSNFSTYINRVHLDYRVEIKYGEVE